MSLIEEKNTIKLKGTILFDPPNITKKHKKQSSWKKHAMIVFEGDLCEYYSWFIFKRYMIKLNPPLRRPHITFVNDRKSEINNKWEEVKSKWNHKKIDIILNIEPRTDSDNEGSKCHWWLNVPEEYRCDIQKIREEAGLSKPFFGLHMTIGFANSKNVEQSKYIHRLIKKRIIRY